MTLDLRPMLYSAETIDLLARLVGTQPTRVYDDPVNFQFEYESRCLVTMWDIEEPAPHAIYDRLVYVTPRWYPDEVDTFPGFDGATVVAEGSPIVATSVVRTLVWDEGLTTPVFPERVDAPVAYLVDVGFTALVADLELACFAQDNWLFSRGTSLVDDVSRTQLLERFQFLPLEEARRSLHP
jgi:hypothetical protein